MYRFIFWICCFCLQACMVGPHYHEPKKLVSEKWIKNTQIKNKPSKINAHWWDVFHDPILTALIHRGYENNLTLQSAAARVLQTRAQLAQSVGELFPQQQAIIGNLTYNQLGGQDLQSLLPSTFETAVAGFSVNWEIDFWGKYRRAILANDAAFLASYAAYDNALVTLTSDIAGSYINIRTTQELITIFQQNVAIQKMGLNIAHSRYTNGQTSLLDVEQAQSELSQTESVIPKLVSELRRNKDRLAVLLGTTPDKVDGLLTQKRGIPKAPWGAAVGIPRETLAKRPDITQARLLAIAQLESIGVAKANLFPSITIPGTIAFASNNINGESLADIFSIRNLTITAGPSVNWPILNYGQITNAVRAQDAIYQQALLNYQNTVLKAQQEVQDHITDFIESKKSERDLIVANQSAIASTKLAIIRYREGESDYTPVLNSEKQQLMVQTSLTNTQGDIPLALVALYRAMGGGWQIRHCRDIVPLSIKRQMAARTNWGDLLRQKNHEAPRNHSQSYNERTLPHW